MPEPSTASASSREPDEHTPLLPSSDLRRASGAQIPSPTTRDAANGNRARANGATDRDIDADEDELDFDARFRKWKSAVARKFKRSDKDRNDHPRALVTVFDGVNESEHLLASLVEVKQRHRVRAADRGDAILMSHQEFERQVNVVKRAIEHGIYPKMITTGSSGSYFVRVPLDDDLLLSGDAARPTAASAVQTKTVAVFKPKDEEPYGNLNPKRQFVRKYLWWAMGRPCLIPNFSYLSEVGASYLDSRLVLRMVPRTELVELSSPSFHYAYADRRAYEENGRPLPEKIGSYQTFLNGYVMASDFLRRHPWPSRSRSLTLMMRDFEDESQAHKISRKREKARLRKCGIALKRLLLCRGGFDETQQDELWDEPDGRLPDPRSSSTMPPQGSTLMSTNAADDMLDSFVWTPKRMQNFRLELEKLVVLDFLMRNTDRGLDNFMIHHDPHKDEIKIGAIDNSLSFPIKHPNEIRQYPFGWLWLPSDLIGLPFSQATRQHFLPILNDPIWWQDTVQGLRRIFDKDPHFDEAKFEKQISVMKGQAWNLVKSLESAEEGPLDLCAREKKLVQSETVEATEEHLNDLEGVKLPLTPSGQIRMDLISAGTSTGAQGQVGLAMFETPTKIRLPRSGSASSARGIAQDRPATSRPIGMRASASYRQALIHAAGAGVEDQEAARAQLEDLPEGAHPRSLPEQSFVDPFADPPTDKVGPVVESAGVVQADSHSQRPSHHQRMLSMQEPSTTSSLLQSRDAGLDPVVGRSGIEVLESLDKQRRKENKRKIFGARKRASTASTVNSVDIPSPIPARMQGKRMNSGPTGHANGSMADACPDGEAEVHDMESSIVSDPGIGQHRHGLHKRSVSDTGAGRMASSGYLRREGSSQWDDGVLSEEDEEEPEESQESQDNVDVRTGAGAAGLTRAPDRDSVRQSGTGLQRSTSADQKQDSVEGSLSPAGRRLDPKRRPSPGRAGPSIEAVLSQVGLPDNDNAKSPSTPTRYAVPHLPHAYALAKASRMGGGVTGTATADSKATAEKGKEDQQAAPQGTEPDGRKASGSFAAPMENGLDGGQQPRSGGGAADSVGGEGEGGRGEGGGNASLSATKRVDRRKRGGKRKIKVVVERLVSDTRQAWLKWI